MRRALDVVVSVAGIAVCLPLWAILGILVKVESRGPVFHRAARVGRGGDVFVVYKLRTMKAAPADDTPGVTRKGDDRITRVGRRLRKLKLDETPQLLNVFKGEMSLVGPRPEDPRYVAGYTPEQREILAVRPGIVSPAALAYRHEEAILAGVNDLERVYREEILPHKLAIDRAYLRDRTLRSDLRVLLQAVAALFRRESDARPDIDR